MSRAKRARATDANRQICGAPRSRLFRYFDLRHCLPNFNSLLAGKWIELLKQIAPHVNRVAMLFNPATAKYADYFLKPFKAAAPSFAVEAITAPARDTSELDSVIAAQAREPNGGLIVMPDSFTDAHRLEITSLVARYRLPAVYAYRFFSELGGLVSYGPDLTDNFRRAAIYVDRILKGWKPADLPVQAPAKYEMVINLKTAPGSRAHDSEGAAAARGRSDPIGIGTSDEHAWPCGGHAGSARRGLERPVCAVFRVPLKRQVLADNGRTSPPLSTQSKRTAYRRLEAELHAPKLRASIVAGGAAGMAMSDRATASATALMTDERWSIVPVGYWRSDEH